MSEIFVNRNNEKYQWPLLSPSPPSPPSSSSFNIFPLLLLQAQVTFIPVWVTAICVVTCACVSVGGFVVGWFAKSSGGFPSNPAALDAVRVGSLVPQPLWAPKVNSSLPKVISPRGSEGRFLFPGQNSWEVY